MTNSILHDLSINSTASKVFKGISDPTFLNEWWTLNCRGTVSLKNEYLLNFGPNYNWHGTVTKCIDQEAFELTIHDSHPDWDGTKVGFEILPQDKSTKLKFYHSDWKEINEHYRISSYCWAVYLRILKGYLEKGIRIPYHERDNV